MLSSCVVRADILQWRQASRAALEFAYQMDMELMAAGEVHHSQQNLAMKKVLADITETAKAAAFVSPLKIRSPADFSS